MKELLEQFENLPKQEKADFLKAVMPQMCELFQDNQQEMMSMCRASAGSSGMMKNCGMDMSKMMGMMSGAGK